MRPYMSTPGVFQDGVVEPYGSVYELQGPGVGSHGLLRALQGPYASLKGLYKALYVHPWPVSSDTEPYRALLLHHATENWEPTLRLTGPYRSYCSLHRALQSLSWDEKHN